MKASPINRLFLIVTLAATVPVACTKSVENNNDTRVGGLSETLESLDICPGCTEIIEEINLLKNRTDSLENRADQTDQEITALISENQSQDLSILALMDNLQKIKEQISKIWAAIAILRSQGNTAQAMTSGSASIPELQAQLIKERATRLKEISELREMILQLRPVISNRQPAKVPSGPQLQELAERLLDVEKKTSLLSVRETGVGKALVISEANLQVTSGDRRSGNIMIDGRLLEKQDADERPLTE